MTQSDSQRGARHPEVRSKQTTEQDLERYRPLLEVLPEAVVVIDATGRITLVNQQTEALFGYARAELLGQPIEHLIPQRFRQAHRRHRASYVAAPTTRPAGRGHQFFGLRRDGTEFPVDVSLSPLPEGEQAPQVLVLATIRDMTVRQQVEHERQQVEQAHLEAEELRRLQAIADVALSHQTLDELLPALLTRLCSVLRVDIAAILLLEPDEQVLTVRAVYGLEARVAAGVRVPLGQGFAGRVAATRAPLVVEDLTTFPVVNPFLREHLRSTLGVPLLVEDQLLGVVHIGTATPHHYTERDTRLLQIAAERIALAIDRARLHDAEQAALAQARQLEAQTTRLLAANLIGVIVAEGDRIIEANDAFLRMVGYTQADVAAGRLRWSEMTPPEYAPLNARALAEVRERGVSSPFEKEYLRKDGSRVPILIRVTRVEECPERHASFVVDLSERQHLQQAVTATAAQLQTTFDTMADLVFVYDVSGYILRMNAAAQAALDLADETEEAAYSALPVAERGACGSPLRTLDGQLLPPEAYPVQQLLRGEVLTPAHPMDVRRTSADSHEQVLSFTGGPMRDAMGMLLGYVAVGHDITARWHLEQQVRFQASLLERTHDAIFVWELGGPIVFWNQGAELLYGYRAEEALGKFAHALLQTHLPRPAAAFEALVLREGEWMGELSHTTQDGHIVDVLSRLQMLRADEPPSPDLYKETRDGPSGVRVYVCETDRDITGRKALERAWAEAEARELAVREINRLLDEFFITAAHDIRNPVSVVKVSAQLARRRFEKVLAVTASPARTRGPIAASTAAEAAPPPHGNGDRARELATRVEAVRESLEAVDASTDRLTRLTDHLFDVARARTGTLELELAPCDLVALCARR